VNIISPKLKSGSPSAQAAPRIEQGNPLRRVPAGGVISEPPPVSGVTFNPAQMTTFPPISALSGNGLLS